MKNQVRLLSLLVGQWLGTGPLANFRADSTRPNNIKVSSLLIDGQWNLEKINQIAPPQMVPNILATQIHYPPHYLDQPFRKPNTNGNFNYSSVWNLIRDKRSKSIINNYTWNKSISFKCSFHLWRTLRGKLPTNEKLTIFG